MVKRDVESKKDTGRHAMQFSTQERQGALQLRDLGLTWEPQAGHYVWDEAGLIEQPSPFQEGVYFILDLKHFLRRAGTMERLKQAMVWLPTWHDARLILQTMGVENGRVADALQAQAALEQNRELLTLYDLIAARLRDLSSIHD
jgi:hypothetical protein